MRPSTRLVLAALTVSAADAYGQQPAGVSLEDKRNVRQEMTVARDPEGASPLRFPVPQFTFQARKGDQRVLGTIGAFFGDTAFDVELSGPIGEDDPEASPLSLDGLGAGATIRFSVARARLFRPPSTKLLDDMESFCKQRSVEVCAMSRLQTPQDRREFMKLFVRRLASMYGVRVTLNREDFTYLARDLQTENDESHGGVGVTGSFGLLVNYAWFVTAHVERQQFHTFTARANEICTPLSGNALRCRVIQLGPPVERTLTIATIELRHRLENLPLAFSPRFQYRAADDAALFELPLYFLRDEADSTSAALAQRLNGGVSVGWQSDEGFAARAFIGVAFNLIDLSRE